MSVHRKSLYIILSVILLGVLVALYFLREREEPFVVRDVEEPVSTSTAHIEPKPKPKPTVTFGSQVCENVGGKRYAKIPITISEKGWFYGETIVAPVVDMAINSNSRKTFENINLSRPFYEIAPEEWGDAVVTVSLWEDKAKSPVVTASSAISAQRACK